MPRVSPGLPPNTAEELLQCGWFQSICAMGGWEFFQATKTDFGIDAKISPVRRVKNEYVPIGVDLDVQMKASTDISVDATSVTYDLTHAAFERMKRHNRYGAVVLVVFALPKAQTDWLDVSDDRTVIQRCGWWIAAGDLRWTPGNTTKCAVKIPLAQRFDPKALKGPLLKLARMRGRSAS